MISSWWMSQVNNIFKPKCQKSNEDSVFQKYQMSFGEWTPPSWCPTLSVLAAMCSSQNPAAPSPVAWGQSRWDIISHHYSKMIIIIPVIIIHHCYRKWARVRSVAGCALGVRITSSWWTSSAAATAGWEGGPTPTRQAALTSRWVRWKSEDKGLGNIYSLKYSKWF